MKKWIIFILIIISTFTMVACQKDEPSDPTEPVETIDLFAVNPHNDIYYQIFVRSFADSNGDGIGDLNGITENLDYLEDLGITALWLLPINPSPSYHGYNITDYYDIHPDYGTLDDFSNLIEEAALRDIKIVIDLVINHTSDQHPWYESARQSVSSPYRNYYIWNNGVAFESFVGGMKDLNFNNPAVIQEVKDIMDFYLEKGVHGFRIDAAKHLLEGTNPTLQNALLLHSFNSYIKEEYPDSFIVSEIFDYQYQLLADYFIGSDSVFNFFAAANIWDKVGLGNSRFNFTSNLKNAYSAYRLINPDFVDSPFIGNHDIDRIASRTGFSGYLGLERLKLATSVLLTLPGSPFIYYGDEIGMKGYRYEGTNIPGYGVVYDEYRRQPLIWGNSAIETTWLPSDGSNAATESILTQQQNENSLWNFYKTMIQLRKDNPALMFGNSFEAFGQNNSNIQGYIRTYQYEDVSQAVLIIHNFSPNTIQLDLEYLELLFNDLSLEAYETVIMTIDINKIGDYI